MQRTLTVRHTVDRHGKPLAVLDDLPGHGAEFYPADLRQLARQLITIANDAEQGMRGQAIYSTQE